MLFKPRKIIIEESVVDEPLTGEILARLKGLPVDFVDGAKISRRPPGPAELVVARRRGRFLKKCPGTPAYQCCDYHVLSLGIGCFYNCRYCFLHEYMNSPFVVYANISDLPAEVERFCAARPSQTVRLGSGEFIDSIAIDDLIDVNAVLVPALSRIKNLVFEIKTKSRHVDHLLGLAHRGRVVVSWSVNSEAMIALEEPQTPPLAERLAAAEQCQTAGYRIGFHFDPLINYPDWENGYKRVIDQIFSRIDPGKIAWISLGALRFKPALKPIIRAKFPDSRLVFGELVPGLDGKLRYFRPIRQAMFERLIEHMKSYSEKVPIYLCMETNKMAQEVGAIAGFSIAQNKAFG